MWTALSLIAAVAPVAPAYAPLIVEISVNGTRASEAVVVMRDPEGAMFVPAAALEAHRIRLNGVTQVAIEGAAYVRLGDLPGQSTSLNEAVQRLELTVPAELFEATDLSFAGLDQGPMTPGGIGFILNYNILGQIGGGSPLASGETELGIFSGANLFQATAVAEWSERGMSATRLDTSWTLDFPGPMRSLRLGDSISRGGVGGPPLRFAGLQFGRNFATAPGFVTLPMPTLSGSAALPSVVDVYLNSILLDSRTVAPGPFAITGIPIMTGGGEVSLVVRDSLGRETLVRESYYAATTMLRAGLHDYSYEIGFLRRDYSRASFRYGAPMASATHRIGVTDSLTVEAHAEASARTQVAGVAAAFGLPGLGLIGGSAGASRSNADAGTMIGFNFQSGMPGLSFGALADYSSAGYRSVGLPRDRAPPRLNAQVFAGLPLPFGTLGASYLLRDSRGGEADAQYLSADASIRLGRLGSLHLAGRRNLSGTNDIAVEASFSMPLGGRTNAQFGVRRGDGGLLAIADVRRNEREGEGWAYRASAALDDNGRRLSGGLSLRTGFGDYDAALDYSGGALAGRFVAGGAIAALGRDIFASSRLSNSFATVKVGDYANVRVYADNHLVARTDSHGRAIVPHLRGYERNSVRIELADLPLDAATTAPETSVRPFGRSGVAIDFGARRSRSAMLLVEVDGFGALPAGATARVHGQDFLAAPGGQVFLAGLTDSNLVEVSWPGGSCSFTLVLPESDDPQPDLGSRSCAPAQILAAQ